MINPTLHTAAIAGLEQAINHALQLDPATLKKLSALNGHIFLFECTSPALNVYLIPGQNDVRLCGIFDGAADTQLKGDAQAFIALITATDPANTLINSELTLYGDSQALIELQKIASQLELDWEAPLTRLFGDVIGHQLGKGLRTGFQLARSAIQNIQRQASDYIVEESHLVPARWEVEKFFSDVEQLALRAERLEAKLRKVSTSLKPQT